MSVATESGTYTAPAIRQTGILIGDEWRPAASGKTFPTINPATEEVICEVAEGDAEDVDLAVHAARSAFESGPWSKMDARDRGRLLLKLADLMEENLDELAALETLDNGKPISDARAADLPAEQPGQHGRGSLREVSVEHVCIRGVGAVQHPVEPVEQHRLSGGRLRIDLGEQCRHVVPGGVADVGGDPVDGTLGGDPRHEGMAVCLDESGHQHGRAEIGDFRSRRCRFAVIERAHRRDASVIVDPHRVGAGDLRIHRDDRRGLDDSTQSRHR